MSVEQTSRFHPLPVIGHADAFYVKHIQQAEKTGDVHARESHKVGRYVTLAMDPTMPWVEKLRHFEHALNRHCAPPAGSSEDVVHFYEKLAELVRRHASQEAVRKVARETDGYKLRQAKGATREELVAEANALRVSVIGPHDLCPHWMTPDTYPQILTRLNAWR